MQLRGKRALMTGVTGGLGPALVEAFLALGAEVLATGRRRTALDELRAGVSHHERLHTAECDVGDAEGTEALFDAWARKGAPDVVVHAAGAWVDGPIESQSDDAIERVVRDNFTSAALVLRAAMRRMRPTGRGSVVMIAASRAADPDASEALFGAAKAAVVHLVEATAKDSGGVRINAVLPGVLDTDENRAKLPGPVRGRVAPAEVARAALWLASDESGGVNGASVRLA
ncbi:MAG TPA: hypothetical protein DEF51_44375 [Myxococcales bacterium]|nr:hypothetical protein [Myxococcales bacterium]